MNNYTTILNTPFLLNDLKDLVSLLKKESDQEYIHLKEYIPAIEEHIAGCPVSEYGGKVVHFEEGEKVFVKGKKYIPVTQLEEGDYAIFDNDFEIVNKIFNKRLFRNKITIFYGETKKTLEKKERKNNIVVPKGFVFIDEDMNKVNSENLFGVHKVYYDEELRELKSAIVGRDNQVRVSFYKKPLTSN